MESVAIHDKPVSKKKKIPTYLVKEEFDGILLFYKGYKEVLKGTKKLEDIMPSSGIRALIVTYLTLLLGTRLDLKLYRVLTGEVGNITGSKKKSGLDVAIFEKRILTPDKINRHFTLVPPKIVLEVDVDVESENLTQEEIIHLRTRKLLESGAEKIIWIFTLSQMIMVAERDKDWLTFGWNRDVEILDGITFNIADYLAEEGIDAGSLI